MLLAAAASALVMVSQLRTLQESFDRLTEVYVVFNQRLAEAHVQAVRVHEQVRRRQKQEVEGGQLPDPAFLKTFTVALRARREQVARARDPIDAALQQPDRFGPGQLEALQTINGALDELEALVERDEVADPVDVLGDVQTQSRVDSLFKSLAVQSRDAVDELGQEVAAERERGEQRTLLLLAAVAALGLLATAGLFLTLRPLRQLSQKVRDLARGDWAQRVEIAGSRRGDEVSQLAEEFNLMAAALQERERRLLRGERLAAAGQLAAQITHEIRNPLSSVGLNVELLEDEIVQASPEARHLLKEITKEVDRLTAVTEDYLRFARRPKPELNPVDLAQQLRGMLDFLRPELDQAGVELTVSLPESSVDVLGDSNQLRQVFMNLVRNAQEAALDDERDSDEPPQVEVELDCKDDAAIVVVRDNGPGIDLPPAKIEQIFEAFYTRKARGTGLGLPTVQQILADHGGSVRVADTSHDGTAFEVRIPTDSEKIAPALAVQQDHP